MNLSCHWRLLVCLGVALLSGCMSGKLSEREFALTRAAARADVDEVKHLLGLGVSPDAVDRDVPLIMAVALKGHVAVAELLVEAGVDINARNAWEETALMWAAAEGHTQMVTLLLDAGAELEARDALGETALMDAAKNGHIAVAEALIKAGADVTVVDSLGQTPLSEATDRQHRKMVDLLLRAGAEKQDAGDSASRP